MILFFYYIANASLFQENFQNLLIFIALNEKVNPIIRINAL